MADLSQIDRNFIVDSKIDKKDVKYWNVEEEPFRLYGVFRENGTLRRMPEKVAEAANTGVVTLHACTAGGRVRFITNSPYIAIYAKMPKIYRMSHFTLTGCGGFDVYVGKKYSGTFVPPYNIEDTFEQVVDFGWENMREITINLPLYAYVSEMYIGLAETAQVLPPKPYTYEKPIVYYGSSITQGGCASRPGNAYSNVISRNLDIDQINLGFSGSARGEEAIAEYIKDLDMSVFVYDYDHNAPDEEHLNNTHEKFFKIIREKNPNLPVVMMSRPQPVLYEWTQKRRDIVYKTYENAKNSGDENVYFLDGPQLMALAGTDGNVDGCHPTDLGFASMARALQPVLEGILEKL